MCRLDQRFDSEDRDQTLIQKLYRVEKQVRNLTFEKRHTQRQLHARPILDEMRTWLEQVLPQVPPRSAIGKALNYLHNEWDKLIRYLDDGGIEIDNNAAENAIRPFVLGRKNWLFSDSVKGVNASANLYSLIETSKRTGWNPTLISATCSRNCRRQRLFTPLKRCCRATSIKTNSGSVEQVRDKGAGFIYRVFRARGTFIAFYDK